MGDALGPRGVYPGTVIHYYRFHDDVLAPVPAAETYVPRGKGRGWPEQCPPIRAAHSFGWDVLASVDLAFQREDEGWSIASSADLEADWVVEPVDGGPAEPLVQAAAWFWDENQELPHPISPEVWPALRDQVKVSTFLFLRTDPGEMLLFEDLPHSGRPFRVLPALVETDWYPASYPWHCVLELDRGHERIEIARGTPLCRLRPVRRDAYFAQEMSATEFETFFDRGQAWLLSHGKGPPSAMMDITGAYARLQRRSSFSVHPYGER